MQKHEHHQTCKRRKRAYFERLFAVISLCILLLLLESIEEASPRIFQTIILSVLIGFLGKLGYRLSLARLD